MIRRLLKFSTVVAIGLLGSCGGGGGNVGTAVCTGTCTPPATVVDFLTVEDVQRVISQAVSEASARKRPATIAVVDRVGNVLGVFRMTGASTNFRISSGRGVSGGLEFIDILPDTFAAVTPAAADAKICARAGHAKHAQHIAHPIHHGNCRGPLPGRRLTDGLSDDALHVFNRQKIGRCRRRRAGSRTNGIADAPAAATTSTQQRDHDDRTAREQPSNHRDAPPDRSVIESGDCAVWTVFAAAVFGNNLG